MVRLAFPIFLVVSGLLHVLPWLIMPDTGQQAAGGGGDATVSIEAAPQSLGDLVAEWTKPPSKTLDVAAPLLQPAPETTDTPPIPAQTKPTQPPPTVLPQPEQMPVLAQVSAPQIETRHSAPSQPTAPAKAAQPPKPEHTAKPKKQSAQAVRSSSPAKSKAKPPSIAQPKKQAKGPGQAAAGTGGAAQQTTGDSRRQANLRRQWGAQINARIARQQRRSEALGQVKLRLVVHTSGKLLSAVLVKGAQTSALNARAIALAKRARPPKAPRKLPAGRYTFDITISFE